ncbi:hypothetical protein PMI22_00490 [Pseudomonas sp. GM21]|uniref:hypothetical protein n=1 Tax=Pseudomonas sp. GM21 TaxID=1144325 RepID=UPI0002722EC2|nr:hypothetical protein [Pseudomonas sp. GM21]EJM25144.1 hypothetical protein PMI22_00490 [Pseudomonas sp. GM21]
MSSSIHSTDSSLEDLRDVQEILVLLSVAMAVIASPTTPIIVARVAAVIAQHTAMAWADLLEGMIESNGGER